MKEFPDKLSEAGEEHSADITSASSDFDLEHAMTERILGNPRAPIKISEHSSLTCGHCGHFHDDVFPELKKAYIDTGKAYVVFSDFPLNAPALHASKVARCVADERYFEFINMLFAAQEEWAYEPNYMEYLEEKAGEFGVDQVLFETCVNDKELQDSIVDRIRAVQAQWDVNATPSFVINNQITISGAHSFEEFDKKIQDALVEIQNGAPSPAVSVDGEEGHEATLDE